MIKILQGEFYRVCKSRLFWACVSISTFFVFALALTFHYDTVKLPTQSGISVVWIGYNKLDRYFKVM